MTSPPQTTGAKPPQHAQLAPPGYDYRAATLDPPSPAHVRAARLACGHTQATAARLVHRADSARWREWERTGPSGRTIDAAVWELYLIKSGLRNLLDITKQS